MKCAENEFGLAGFQVKVERVVDLSASNLKQFQKKFSKS